MVLVQHAEINESWRLADITRFVDALKIAVMLLYHKKKNKKEPPNRGLLPIAKW